MKVTFLSLSCILGAWLAQASPIPSSIADPKDLVFVPSNIDAPKAILIPEDKPIVNIANQGVVLGHNKAAVVANAKDILLQQAEALAKAKALAIAQAAEKAKLILAQQQRVDQAISVLPLGDSITFGLGAIDLNSYRNQLQERLGLDAVAIQFIGNVKSGVMANNENEGRSGATIDQIAAFAQEILHLQPQVVTLIAGTNDIFQGLDIQNAPLRLLNLVTQIQAASPHSTILVGSIPPLALGNNQAHVDAFNQAIQLLLEAREKAGQRVQFVDLRHAVLVEDLADGIHPNANGYVNIGIAFAQAFENILEKGWIQSIV